MTPQRAMRYVIDDAIDLWRDQMVQEGYIKAEDVSALYDPDTIKSLARTIRTKLTDAGWEDVKVTP